MCNGPSKNAFIINSTEFLMLAYYWSKMRDPGASLILIIKFTTIFYNL